MCELCGCAEKRFSKQARRENVETGIPIRIPVIAVPIENEAADASAAGGKPVADDGRAGEVDKRTLEPSAPSSA